MSESLAAFSKRVTIAGDHPCVPGHFPGRPLVPAVLLLETVARALQEQLGTAHITAVHSAKFLLPVLPDQPIDVQLAIDATRHRAGFRLHVEDHLAAHGELGFRKL
jgi:3-hydroxymyristoyl/3-hydroxydecanoyl-(acyl carrier protein) dehydratase